MKFAQIIEFETTRGEDLNSLQKQWEEATEGERAQAIAVVGQDRDRPNHYSILAIFDSYDEAMRNSSLPATNAFAEQLAKLSDTPVQFTNLDVVNEVKHDA